MKNKVVEKYLNNFALINTEGMGVFAREQSKLLSPALIATTTDYRGTLTEHGIDGFFRGLTEWSKHFQSNHHSRKEFLEDTPTRVSVRVLNRLGLVVPVNGRTISEENEHEWTEEFEVAPDGLITKVHVRVILNERPQRPERTSVPRRSLSRCHGEQNEPADGDASRAHDSRANSYRTPPHRLGWRRAE